MKKHIPNFITLLNLACGTVAIVLAHWKGTGNGRSTCCLLPLFLIFWMAWLPVCSRQAVRSGKQLDSLADMVTFGVLPAIFIYSIFKTTVYGVRVRALSPKPSVVHAYFGGSWCRLCQPSAWPVLIWRRAGHTFFSGLPTPAHALFWTGLYWQFMENGTALWHCGQSLFSCGPS